MSIEELLCGEFEAYGDAEDQVEANLDLTGNDDPAFAHCGNSKKEIAAAKKKKQTTRRVRKRNWCFTYNNYDICPIVTPMDECVRVKWMRYGMEVGAQGTPHLQGCVQFKHEISKPTEMFDWGWKCHWEAMKGTIQQNLDYTGKEANFDDGTLQEFGERPLTNAERRRAGAAASNERYKEIIDMAEKGQFDEIKAKHPGDFLRMGKRLHEVHVEFNCKRKKTDIMQGGHKMHIWCSGKTGTGKSTAVWEHCGEDLYLKDKNKWWDNYKGEKYVLIEDFEPDWTGKAKLKTWADRYPFTVEFKGGSTTIRPKMLIVTSNYRLEDAEFREQDVDPLKRRFQQCNAGQFKTVLDVMNAANDHAAAGPSTSGANAN